MIKYLATNEVTLRKYYEFEKKRKVNVIILSEDDIIELLTSDPLELNINILESDVSFIDDISLCLTYWDYDQEEVIKAFNERAYDDYISTKHEEERSK